MTEATMPLTTAAPMLPAQAPDAIAVLALLRSQHQLATQIRLAGLMSTSLVSGVGAHGRSA